MQPATAGERPLTARSVVASILLGTQPPELPGQLLVRAGELFGISEGTIRTALSRMTAAGELTAVGDGRYRLTGHLLARQTRQDQSRRPPQKKWTGAWSTAVVTAEGRSASDRAALRDAMGALRMAELRGGVWLRPDNLRASRSGASSIVDRHCTWFSSWPTDVESAE